MKKTDQIEFRKLLSVFVDQCGRGADTDSVVKGVLVLESFIDRIVTKEISQFLTDNSQLTRDGMLKGGKLKN